MRGGVNSDETVRSTDEEERAIETYIDGKREISYPINRRGYRKDGLIGLKRREEKGWMRRGRIFGPTKVECQADTSYPTILQRWENKKQRLTMNSTACQLTPL